MVRCSPAFQAKLYLGPEQCKYMSSKMNKDKIYFKKCSNIVETAGYQEFNCYFTFQDIWVVKSEASVYIYS